MKKTLLSLIALFITTIAFASVKIDGIYYNLNNDNKTAEVTYENYENNYGVTTLTIPSSVTYNSETYSVTSIGDMAFSSCSSLTSITIPNSVTSIGDYAFCGCSSLSSITIPNSVTLIGESAFSSCSSLTSITIPNSVTEIGPYAFCSCSSLSTISILNSITSIGGHAFLDTPWLNSQLNGCVYINNCLYTYKGEMSENTHIDVKEGTTQICGSAFYYCSFLTSVSIPNSVTEIGDQAFYGCSSLSSIIIPNSVTEIGGYAFHDTPWLNNQPNGCIYINNLLYTYKGEMPANTHINVKEGTTQICGNAFRRCSSLISITIPNSVTKIGDQAFADCSSLTSVAIPNGVTSIGNFAFNGCTSLTSITIPNSITSIGIAAFADCTSLTSIAIPDNVTKIRDQLFSNCTSLTSITIPNSVISIGVYIIYGCTSLTSITAPASIFNQVTEDIQVNCSNIIEKINVNVGELDENGLNFIYLSKKTLHTIDLNSTTNTAISDKAFYECYKIENLTLPSNIETIGYKAFADCVKLKSISFPASLKSIDDLAFANCTNIDTIQVDAIVPPTITATSFDKVSRDIEFIVPEEARNAYAEHEYWKEFIQKAPTNVENNESVNTEIFTQNGSLHIDGIIADYQIYNTSGQLVYSGNASTLSLPRGIYLITIKGETQKIAL